MPRPSEIETHRRLYAKVRVEFRSNGRWHPVKVRFYSTEEASQIMGWLKDGGYRKGQAYRIVG